jgi:hypothetical protein
LPTAALFRGEQTIATFRTAWDSQASWLAIKGGTPAASHGQMDVGSFVYDSRGTRWFHDLGGDSYTLPAYFGGKRWDYLRLQNRSHNTLEIGGKLQNPHSKPCPITSSSTSGGAFAVTFDLSNAYAGSAHHVLRSATFHSHDGTFRIEDHITAPSGDVIWRAVTDADCEVQGDSVILRKNPGGQVTLRRVSQAGTWSINELKPRTAAENQNHGYRAVVLTAPKADIVSLVVEINP